MRMKNFLMCSIFLLSMKISVFAGEGGSTRIGGLALSPDAYGFFHSGPHFFKDGSKNTHINFNYKAALWVGAVTPEFGKTVTAGDGNESTTEPEWRSYPKLNSLEEKPVLSKMRETEYGDAHDVTAHNPLGLAVVQEMYHGEKFPFAIVRFKIVMLGNAPLDSVFLSFVNDIDIPNSENKFDRGKDHFGVTADGLTAFVYKTQGNDKKRDLLGVTALNIDAPAIFASTSDLAQLADSERYDLMMQRQTEGLPELQDYNFGIGGGALQLAPDDTLIFDLAIVFGKDEKKFLDNVIEAKNAYQEELPPVALLKQSGALAQRNPLDQMPESFHLFPSFPNPSAGLKNTVSFQLPAESRISLVVYNTLGQQVAVILDDELYASGLHKVVWNAGNAAGALLTPGVYFYRLTAYQNNQAVYTANQKTIITY